MAAATPEAGARLMDLTWPCLARPTAGRATLDLIGVSLPLLLLALGVALELRARRADRGDEAAGASERAPPSERGENPPAAGP